jgi:hypothetical protein
MTVTKADICNRALLAAGSRIQITGFPPTDTSVEATTCSILFDQTFSAVAQAAQWNQFRRQVTLTLLAAAAGTAENPDGLTLPLAPVPWSYEYQYPADCLNFMWIVPTFPGSSDDIPISTANNAATVILPTGGQIPYAVALEYFATAPTIPVTVILTNQSEALGVYVQHQDDPQYWTDSMFTQAMVASLAAFLVPALALSAPLMDKNIAIATKILASAEASNANEGVTVMDHVPDWLTARAGAPGYRYGFYNPGQLFTPISWPSYG